MIIEHDSIEVPNTLKEVKLFEEVLENGLREHKITVEKATIIMGSQSGDNFCSQIYRVNIKYRRDDRKDLEEISVIIKSIPIVEQTQFLMDLKVYLKEKVIFFDILPKMEILLDNIRFGPKCYMTLKEPICTLIMEDLKASNFEMADRLKGLNYEHAKLVLQKLGKFHATSMLLAKKDPSSMKNFSFGLLTTELLKTSEIYKVVFGGNLSALIDVASKWQGFEQIVSKLKNINSNWIDRISKVIQRHDKEVKVLNHGDLWVNNIMFQYDQRKRLSDVMFIDYQMSFYTSPGIDLNYFFNTSLEADVLKTKRETLILDYYTSLKNTLEQLNYKPIPSFEAIQKEILSKEFYGFTAMFGVFLLMMIDKGESGDSSIENLATSPEAMQAKRESSFNAPRCQAILQYSLKRFNTLGVLD